MSSDVLKSLGTHSPNARDLYPALTVMFSTCPLRGELGFVGSWGPGKLS